VELLDGARLTLLSPGQSQLSKLRNGWRKVLAEKGIDKPEDAKAVLELLAKRLDLQPPTRGRRAFGDDKAPANGSSIAFLLEYGGRSVLLSGDAHAPVLLASLQRLARAQGRPKVKVDAFKLPHHGSKSNVSEALFQAIDCMQFLVSTNGAKFNHPDSDTIELLGRVYGKGTTKPKIFFNYRCETTKRWAEQNAQRKANVVAEYPSSEDQGLVVVL
jgi:beta-lactamase superfamily II metal-dependent hydrolase